MAYPFTSLDPETGILPFERMLFLGEPFTAVEAKATGISAKELRTMVRDGWVRSVLDGVYVDAASADTLDLRAAALFKVVPRNAVICDHTAAWLHGADVLGPTVQQGVPAVEVFRFDGDNRIRRSGCSGGTRSLDPAVDIVEIRGMLVTTPLRTALDLGRLLPRGQAIGALDALMRVGGFSTYDMTQQLGRFRGARGVIQLRQLVPLADGRAESPAESLTRLRLLDAGLPLPQVQWEVVNVVGIVLYRLDLAYPDLMLAIEYDGREFHTSDEDRARDAERRADLRRLGWTFVIVTSQDVYGAHPQVARLVREKMQALSMRKAG